MSLGSARDSVITQECSEVIQDDAALMARWYGTAAVKGVVSKGSPWSEVVKEVRKAWRLGEEAPRTPDLRRERNPARPPPPIFTTTAPSNPNKHNMARVAMLRDRMKRIVNYTERQEIALRNLQPEFLEVRKELAFLHGDLATRDVRGTTPAPRTTRTMSHHRKYS